VRKGDIIIEWVLTTGHTIVAYDHNPVTVESAREAGVEGVDAF
jgi:6-phosphogluconate dehydrogenase (decarboxylating)